jgi:hypothetical protein
LIKNIVAAISLDVSGTKRNPKINLKLCEKGTICKTHKCITHHTISSACVYLYMISNRSFHLIFGKTSLSVLRLKNGSGFFIAGSILIFPVESQTGKTPRVDRVLGFFSSRPNWFLPQSLTHGVFLPPPFWFRGGHTRFRERGCGGPSSDEGTCTVVLYVYYIYVLVERSHNPTIFTLRRPKSYHYHYYFSIIIYLNGYFQEELPMSVSPYRK